MNEDPISQFFPGEEEVDLYAVLKLKSTAKSEDIKKSYRKFALLYHPDKHVSSSDEARKDASHRFQQVGYAYAVLSDEKRRERYDKTGRTDEGLEMQPGEDGWDAYFSELFERVTKGKLDEMKKEYQGSTEEVEDLKRAYTETDGLLEDIMSHIPHSTFEDEPRFITLITRLVKDGDLPKSKLWEKSSKDESAKLVRKKQGEKEAAEAEELAKELGVWDEFYGSGKAGPRRNKGKGKATNEEVEEDVSALQALILKKKKNMGGFLDNLASKYAEPIPKSKGKKGRKRTDEDADDSQGSSAKRAKTVSATDIDEAEFARIQTRLKANSASATASKASTRKQKT